MTRSVDSSYRVLPKVSVSDRLVVSPQGRVSATAGQRAPRDDPDALVGAERVHLPLLLAVEQVVVVLHRDEAVPAVDPLQVERLGELPGVHRRGAEVAHLAGVDQVAERLQRLLDRRRAIPAVDLVEVDVVHPEPPQARVALGEDRLARQPRPVRSVAHPAVHLGGDDQLVPAPVLGQRAADDLLARPGGVDVRRVEEVDPGLDGRPDQRATLVLRQRPRMRSAVGFAEGHAPHAQR